MTTMGMKSSSLTANDFDGHFARNTQVWPGWTLISWKAIWAGVALAIALQVLLTMLGAAIGMSAAKPRFVGGELGMSAEIWDGIPVVVGMWWILTGIVSLSVGGAIAAQCAGAFRWCDGAVQGALTWAVMLLVGGLVASAGLSGAAAAGIGAWNAAGAPTRSSTERITPAAGNPQDADRPRNPDGTVMSDAQMQMALESARKAAAMSAWWAFGSLAIGLGAATAGGVLSAGRAARVRHPNTTAAVV